MSNCLQLGLPTKTATVVPSLFLWILGTPVIERKDGIPENPGKTDFTISPVKLPKIYYFVKTVLSKLMC